MQDLYKVIADAIEFQRLSPGVAEVTEEYAVRVAHGIQIGLLANYADAKIEVLNGKFIIHLYHPMSDLPEEVQLNTQPIFRIYFGLQENFLHGRDEVRIEPVFLAKSYPMLLTTRQAAMAAALQSLRGILTDGFDPQRDMAALKRELQAVSAVHESWND